MLKLRFCEFIFLIALLLGTSCTKEGRLQRHLDRANNDFQAGRYESAEIEYLAALRLVPLQPVALRQLGIINADNGRLLQAFAYLRKATGQEPDNVEVHLRLALIYMEFHQFKEARGEATWVLERKAGDEEALLVLTEIALTPREITEMHQRLDQFRQNDQERAIYHAAQATLYLRQNDLNQAGFEIKNALALDPKSSSVQLVLGNCSWARNDLKTAEQAFKAAAEAAQLRSSTRLKYANFKMKTGSLDGAKAILEEITRKVPDYLPAWNYLMQLAFAQKKFDDCSALAGKILSRDPVNYDGLMMTGNLHLVKNEGSEAVKDFQRMAATYGQVPQVKYQLALAYLTDGNSENASKSLDEALQIAPDFSDAILMQAELNLRSDSITAAIVSLTRLIKQQPQIRKAHLLLATAYLNQRDPDAALVVYGRMTALFPKSPDVYVLMGSVLIQQNKLAEARSATTKALEFAPDYLAGIEQMVNIEMLEKNYPAALALVKAQLERRPESAELWLILAKVYAVQKDSDQAEIAALKGIHLNPDLRNGYLLLAEVYVSNHQEQQALDLLNALVVKTNDVVAMMQIGTIHQKLKQFPQAREAFEKVIAAKPEFIAALNNLAYLYSENFNQLDKAAMLAERARRLQPGDPFTADTYGWILYRKGDYARALALITQSASRIPDQPEVQFHLGMTYYMMGREAPARSALRLATQSPIDFPGKQEGRNRLALLDLDIKTIPQDAVQDLEKRRLAAPNDPVLLDRLAALYLRTYDDVDKARRMYEKILQQNPNNVQTTVKLAQLYNGRLNNLAKALELAKIAHKLAPDDASISGILGELLLADGDYQWATSLLQEASRRLPTEPKIYYDLAWAFYNQGRITEAETAMQAALQVNAPFDSADDAKCFLAMIALSSQPFPPEGSFAEAQKILSGRPTYVPALMVTAAIADQRGNYWEAKTIYEKILATNSRFAAASRNLAILYYSHLADDQKAYLLAIAVRANYPDDPELSKVLGVLACHRSEYPRAAQLLMESTEKRKTDPEALYYLGVAQYHLKQQNECRQTLQRALALNTIPPKLAEEARLLLSQLN